MADDQLQKPPRDGGHPVLVGLAALVAVALVVGALVGGGALVASRALGLSGSDGSSEGSTSRETLFLPPRPTAGTSEGPGVTIPGDPSAPTSTLEDPDPTAPATPDTSITLTAAQTAVAPMQNIDLTGAYPGGEGSVLQVQQFGAGAWEDFPVNVSVVNETFSTFIQAGGLGLNRFRVLDIDTGEASNEIRVQIG